MKKIIKVGIEEDDYKRLMQKATERNIIGRGWTADFLKMMAREEFIFINKDTKNLFEMLKIKVQK